MKRSAGIFLLIILLIGANVPAHAQFWKNWFKKEQHNRKYTPRKKPAKSKQDTQKNEEEVTKKKTVEYPSSQIKERYRIDLLAPLYLDELVKNGKTTFKTKLPEKAQSGVDFYQGLKIAADTLNILGYKVDVYMHDIADANNTPEKMIATGKLDNTDLIIGLVQAEDMVTISGFAKKNNINFVSALLPFDAGITDNPYFILLQPSLQEHCARIIQALNSKHRKKRIILLHNTQPGLDDIAFKSLTEDEKVDYQKLLCNTAPAKTQLLSLLDSTQVNVVVMAFMDNDYAASILKQLSTQFPGYQFEIYGMPSWKMPDFLRKIEEYQNIAVNITAPFHFDTSTPLAQYLEHVHKKTYGERPGEMVYRGYEAVFWYTTLLKRYGTIFNNKMGDSKDAPFTKFNIKPMWTQDGTFLYNENIHAYLYRYQGGSYSVE